jgi:hypothetical protein
MKFIDKLTILYYFGAQRQNGRFVQRHEILCIYNEHGLDHFPVVFFLFCYPYIRQYSFNKSLLSHR